MISFELLDLTRAADALERIAKALEQLTEPFEDDTDRQGVDVPIGQDGKPEIV
jgi:hypothetical protein